MGFKKIMKRWNKTDMQALGLKLFKRVHQQKRHASPNHDVHFMARQLSTWLPQGIQALLDGRYTPRFLKRHYFKDERVDELHVADRVFQHLLLQQLKPTFSSAMNPNCYHLQGPNGVKQATQNIKQVLKEHKPHYLIRPDVKSFYKSIPHSLLIQDINQHYDCLKVQDMLKNIITNPIETYKGDINPDYRIALRGPLSQFFSALYLKPLDDAFNRMQVHYFRFQDDVLILCQSKRQLNRCKQRLMSVLKSRQLSLSCKKTRMGSVDRGFHFLGIQYPGTHPLDNTTQTQALNNTPGPRITAHYLFSLSEGRAECSQAPEPGRIVPHPRTLRKAREHVKQMVDTGASPRRINNYLQGRLRWWIRTTDTWTILELLSAFLATCWEPAPAAYAARLLVSAIRSSEMKAAHSTFHSGLVLEAGSRAV